MDYERVSTHDKASGTHGFEVEPEQLAHDLTILKLYKTLELEPDTDDVIIYDAYRNALADFRVLIDDKMRYDGN